MFLSLISRLNQLHSPPMIVALHDPPVRTGRLPSFSTYNYFHHPVTKPRVAFYVHPHHLNSVSLLPIVTSHPDLLSIDIFAAGGFYELQFSHLRIINAYNLPLFRAPFRTISPSDIFQDSSFPTLIVADLNLYHSLADPLRVLSPGKYCLSHPYFNQVSKYGFALLN